MNSLQAVYENAVAEWGFVPNQLSTLGISKTAGAPIRFSDSCGCMSACALDVGAGDGEQQHAREQRPGNQMARETS